MSNPAVELIHASYDDVPEDALRWARKAKFPWPTILMPDWKEVGLNKYEALAGEIFLVDHSGKLLTKDEDEAFDMITSLK